MGSGYQDVGLSLEGGKAYVRLNSMNGGCGEGLNCLNLTIATYYAKTTTSLTLAIGYVFVYCSLPL